ncbi:MAG: Na+/H+ antiporter subunit D [Phycisphaerales bacterium]|nr:Na+/H+ antiporter subunit D [Phycisphaerales bacterium]
MNLLAVPILLPLVFASVMLATRWPRVQRLLSVAGALGLFLVNLAILWQVDRVGVATLQVGGWPAPAGITLVADRLSAVMLVMTGAMGLGIAVYSLGEIRRRKQRFGYHTLLHVLLMGVCGAFLTGDLFNLFVWYEVMLIASFVLLTLGGRRGQLEGAIKYVTINLVASAFFLAALGVLYGMTGTLNMADLAHAVDRIDRPELLTVLAMMFLVAFGLKAGVFPLFFWLPASYHTPPTAITAIFSALLTKVGVYSMIRMFTLVFVQNVGWTHGLLLAIAGLTMVSGVLGAAVQSDMRRILSFHIVSQIGYLLMGLGLAGPAVAALHVPGRTLNDRAAMAVAALGLGGTVFFMVHVILAKTALFLVCGVVERLRRSASLDRVGGLATTHPVLAGLFLVAALSLAGIPPLAGFWAKFMLVRAGLEGAAWVVTTAALGTGLLTLYSMTKIWAEAFWKPLPAGELQRRDRVMTRGTRLLMYGPTFAIVGAIVAIGLWPASLEAFATRTAAQLVDPSEYVAAVSNHAIFSRSDRERAAMPADSGTSGEAPR